MLLKIAHSIHGAGVCPKHVFTERVRDDCTKTSFSKRVSAVVQQRSRCLSTLEEGRVEYEKQEPKV